MKKEQLKRLVTILKMQAESYDTQAQADLAEQSLELVGEDAHKLLIEVDKAGNYYITKGNADLYPCVVAHLDQVHKTSKVFRIYRDKDILFAFNGKKQVGTGGDDKCGVFLAVEMLLQFDVLKVAFFVDEEVGCIGSGSADISFFKDCSFILQGDRNHAKNDFITFTNGIKVVSDEFLEACKPYLEKHGFAEARGSCTDVGELVDSKCGCCGVNIASGYIHAHTSSEIISISKLDLTLGLFVDIITNVSHKRWEYTAPTFQYTRTGGHSTYNNYSQGYKAYEQKSWWDEYYARNPQFKKYDTNSKIRYGSGNGNGAPTKNVPFTNNKDVVPLYPATICPNCRDKTFIKYGEFVYCTQCHRGETIHGVVTYGGDTVKKSASIGDNII